MAETWATVSSYRLHDLLMFSADTYFRLFELVNRQVWPAPVVCMALALVVVMATWQRRFTTAVCGALALAWGAVALLYFHRAYAGIHWLGPGWAAAFALQVLLWLGVAGVAGPAPAPAPSRHPRRWLGAALMVLALAWPLLPALLQRPWWQAEWPGLAPDATVLLSLGVVLTLSLRRRWAAAALAVPLAWCVYSGATLWAMAQPHAWVLPLLAGASVYLLMRRP